MKQKILYCILLLIRFTSTQAQTKVTYDTGFRFYYYDHKLSMFEQNTETKQDMIWFGDSITDGCEWSEFFKKKKVLNRGISADNTFGLLNRIYEVVKRKPKKLFILIGINDISKNIPDSVIIRNFNRLVDSVQLQSPKTKIYLQSLLPTNNEFTTFKNHQNKEANIAAVNTALQTICTTKNCTYVDLHTAFKNSEGKLDKKYTVDGLHLNGEGYTHWVNLIKAIL